MKTIRQTAFNLFVSAVVLAAVKTIAKQAADGDGTMTVNPTNVVTGSTNTLVFIFKSPNAENFPTDSQLSLDIPSDWTAPQTNSSSSPGFVSATPNGNTVISAVSITNRNIVLSMLINANNTLTITYSNAVAGVAGTATFTAKSKSSSTGTLSNLLVSPTVTVSGVNKTNTSVVLISSANPSPTGSNVTFTAALTTVPPGSGTPAGTVQFLADGAPLGSPVALTSGAASVGTSSLSHGTHTITAQYAGDSNFFGSTNNLSPNQVINTAPVAGNVTLYRYPQLGVTVSLSTLLTNASDADGDTLNITVSPTSTNGATITVAGGWVVYTPPAGFTNADAYTYTVTDSYGGSAVGTVVIQVDNNPSQNLTITNLGNGSFLINGIGLPDYTYRLQYSDVSGPYVWQDLLGVTADSTGRFQYTDTYASSTRFYRTVYP